jgi:hypothetical protein
MKLATSKRITDGMIYYSDSFGTRYSKIISKRENTSVRTTQNGSLAYRRRKQEKDQAGISDSPDTTQSQKASQKTSITSSLEELLFSVVPDFDIN